MSTESTQLKSALSLKDPFIVFAGPCSIESEQQFETIAKSVIQSGAFGLRGGIYKLRTRASSFQGLGDKGFAIAKTVKSKLNVPFISEITDPRQMPQFEDTVDMYQVGTRNMFNYELLKELGKSKKPVLLKRGFSARIKEWLYAADYITSSGNDQVILCERGIRTFETDMRNTLDLGAVAYVKKYTSFLCFVDPSHGTGNSELVPNLAKAALAVGADGLLVEVHNDPKSALSDGDQALNLEDFKTMMSDLKKLSSALK